MNMSICVLKQSVTHAYTYIMSKRILTGLPAARSEISGPNFEKISGHFCRFHEAQETENARFSVLINVIIIRTKANWHFYKHI